MEGVFGSRMGSRPKVDRIVDDDEISNQHREQSRIKCIPSFSFMRILPSASHGCRGETKPSYADGSVGIEIVRNILCGSRRIWSNNFVGRRSAMRETGSLNSDGRLPKASVLNG